MKIYLQNITKWSKHFSQNKTRTQSRTRAKTQAQEETRNKILWGTRSHTQWSVKIEKTTRACN